MLCAKRSRIPHLYYNAARDRSGREFGIKFACLLSTGRRTPQSSETLDRVTSLRLNNVFAPSFARAEGHFRSVASCQSDDVVVARKKLMALHRELEEDAWKKRKIRVS
jgi:hypothetical protein